MARRSIEKAEERLQQRIAAAEEELRLREGMVAAQQGVLNGLRLALEDLQAAPEEKGDDS